LDAGGGSAAVPAAAFSQRRCPLQARLAGARRDPDLQPRGLEGKITVTQTVLAPHMPQIVEINLRLPSLRVKDEHGGDPKTINNSDVRFTKRLEVDSIPKPGAILTMTADNGLTFPCEVVQANWHESNNLFVVACRFERRSITPAEYQAISNSSDWLTKPLL
jgi:hypothetical protein